MSADIDESTPGLIKHRQTMITMEQMVDLSLGCPEIGAVNFNVLHCIMHVIIQQLNIQRCLVEFKDHDAERMEGILSSARPGPLLRLHEYMIDLSDGRSIRTGAKSKSRDTTPRSKRCDDEKKIREDKPERYDKDRGDEKTDKSEKKEKEDKKDKKDKKEKKEKKEKPCPCVSGSGAGSGKGGSSKSSTYYGSDGEGLQTVVLVEPIGEKCDTWRSRPTLAHESMVKLEEKVALLQECFEAMEGMPTNKELIEQTKSKRPTPVADMWQLYNLHKRMESAEGGIAKLTSMIEDILHDCDVIKEALALVAEEIDGLEGDADWKSMSPLQKFQWLKDHIDEILAQLKLLTDAFPMNQVVAKLQLITTLQKQVESLEKEFRDFLDTLGEGGIHGLMKTIEDLQTDMTNVHEAINLLIAGKEDTDAKLNLIFSEIEKLKIYKADKDYVEDLLAEKADASVVNRKVSHDQFDAACDDLTKGLEDALERLREQEAMWNEAMEELQKDLENKLDKAEISPLKDFINRKLKCLQDKLKQLAQLRKEAEAAGTKSKLLRNVNCISCNADVVMKMENECGQQAPALPSGRSMRPYLTYELDQIRKAMRKAVPPSKNLQQLEEVMSEQDKKKAYALMEKIENPEHRLSKLEHLCNRYCGGSHTITTPQQRVTRIGHFLTEFGPQAIAMFQQELTAATESRMTSGNVTSRSNAPN